MNERGCGLLIHITSLPSKYGVGDLGKSAFDFVDVLSDSGQSYWQILPLNRPDDYSYSPYFSTSSFALNPMLIGFDGLLAEGFLNREDIEEKNGFFPAGSVDFPKVSAYKYHLLDKAYENFLRKRKKNDFNKFCQSESYWLEDYALFTALKNKFNKESWDKWPEEIRNRKPAAMESAKKRLKKDIKREKFFQFIFYKQWFALKTYSAEKRIKIIGDIPIYVGYDSCDVWANNQIFKLDENKHPFVVSGVPPDYFSKTGQLWNNPVYKWEVLKETKYDWWVKRMKHMFKFFDVMRIDHFRGLVQYWEVPATEKTAVNGYWQSVPTYDFFDTLMKEIESFPVIAEDLGHITDDVREAMAHYGFPGMKIFQFAFGEDNPDHPYLPHTYKENCVAYTGTHDNNTLMGWLENEVNEEQKKRLLAYLKIDEIRPDINWVIMEQLMASLADIVIFPVQDVLGLGSDARMNRPQVASGNWRWRLLPDSIKKIHMDKLRNLTKLTARDIR